MPPLEQIVIAYGCAALLMLAYLVVSLIRYMHKPAFREQFFHGSGHVLYPEDVPIWLAASLLSICIMASLGWPGALALNALIHAFKLPPPGGGKRDDKLEPVEAEG